MIDGTNVFLLSASASDLGQRFPNWGAGTSWGTSAVPKRYNEIEYLK